MSPVLLMLLVLTTSAASENPAQLASDEQKAVYSLGLSLFRVLAPLDLNSDELRIVERGLEDAASGKPVITPEDVQRQVAAMRRARAPRALEKEKARSAAYLEKVAKEPGSATTPSGVVYFDLQPGAGETPATGATVKVRYRGTLIDGTEFDSAGDGKPASLRLADVIACLREGLSRMRVGGKSRLVCPANSAYGDAGRPSVPGGAALVFELDLLEIVKATPGEATPSTPKPPGSR